MNLRLRLIVAFFLLSVVPLAAVTLFTYTSNAEAMREAAKHESELLAGELTQRMDLVTEQLSARVAHLMEVQREAVATSGVRSAAARPAPAAPAAPAAPDPPETMAEAAAAAAVEGSNDTVAGALGEVAMLLNNIEVRGMRGPGDRRGGSPGGPPSGDGRRGGGGRGFPSGRGSRPDGLPPAPATPGTPLPPPTPPLAVPATAPTSAAAAPVPPGGPAAGGVSAPTPSAGLSGGAVRPDVGPPSGRGDPSRGDPQDRRFGGRFPPDPNRPGPPPDRSVPRSGTPDAVAGRSGPPTVPGTPIAAPGLDERDRILFDMMPIRREIMQQLVGSGEQWEKLTPEERQRIVAEVNQRMLGIVQGIQLGAAEVQKKVVEAQRAAGEKARESSPRTAPAAPRPVNRPRAAGIPVVRNASAGAAGATRRRTALSGSRLDVTVERNGEVLRRANAEVNLPNLLATVFTTTRRDRGEVPFAVAKDGRLYTPTEDDRKQVEAISNGMVKADAVPGTTVTPEWIVVTTADPNGSGLKFGIARPVGESLNQLRRTSVRNAAVGLGFIGLALIGIVPLSSRLTRHLSTLSDGVNRIAQGDYAARVQVGSNDEIGRLARAFNQMAEDVEQHQRDAVKQERIRRELELGRQIQADMLPQGPLRVGETEIKGVSVPAREVGGDFFNYFAMVDWRIALLVGDVSGKGVGAALLMANIQASLRTRLALGQDLAAIAREIDVDVEGNTPGPVYATLFMGILDPVTRELIYVNAGHNPQYVIRKDGRLEHMSSSGLPIGLLAGRGYSETRIQLQPGDLIFCYTDGCVETENDAEEMFGAERLESLLLASAGADDLLSRVESVIAEFRGGREAFDDATMMVVKVG